MSMSAASPRTDVRASAAPYTGWAGFNSSHGLPRAQAKELLLHCATNDIRAVMIGSRNLDLYEEVDREIPLNGRRWVISHISMTSPREIEKIARMGLVLTTHTNNYLYKGLHELAQRLPPERHREINPLRSLADAGVKVSLATDNVPVSPFLPMSQAITRATYQTNERVAPEEALSRADALRCATANGAYLTFDEDKKGSLEAGQARRPRGLECRSSYGRGGKHLGYPLADDHGGRSNCARNIKLARLTRHAGGDTTMATMLKEVDAVCIGVGFTGSILARELTKAGLKVVGLERGPDRSTREDFALPSVRDDLKYAVRQELFQDTQTETVTLRHSPAETALPLRRLGSFLPGTGVGGAGSHWNGVTWRLLAVRSRPENPSAEPLRPQCRPRRDDDRGLPGLLCRARALLRPVRETVRHLRQGRQSARQDHRRRQRVRGSAPERISQQAAGADHGRLADAAGREGAWAITRSRRLRRT